MSCLAAAMSLIIIAHAEGPCANGWTRADTRRAWADRVITIVDWSQTRWIKEHGAEHGIYEAGVFLGRDPSKSRIDTHFLVVMAIKPIVYWATPPKYREALQYINIGVGLGTIGHNYFLGVRLDLD